jgi:hypothetical protein
MYSYVQGHMAVHATSQEKAPEHEHAVCVSFSDFSFWCFRCDDYIEDAVCSLNVIFIIITKITTFCYYHYY